MIIPKGNLPHWGRSSHGPMANRLECGIVVSNFEVQSPYYVPFGTNTIGERMNPFILSPALG